MNIDYVLPETVNKSNVMDLFTAIRTQVHKSKRELTIDCTNVISIDSAGIALLLELTTSAEFINSIILTNQSSSIQELCQLYQINL